MLVERISRAEVLVRLALCLAAALVLLILLHGWTGPQPFREGSVVPHGIVARVPFEKPDPERTRAARERAAAQVRDYLHIMTMKLSRCRPQYCAEVASRCTNTDDGC
jgi:hypothetical protein